MLRPFHLYFHTFSDLEIFDCVRSLLITVLLDNSDRNAYVDFLKITSQLIRKPGRVASKNSKWDYCSALHGMIIAPRGNYRQ